MDLLILTILNILFFSPLIATIFYFLKVIIKIPSIFVLELLISDITILFWAFAGIPVLINQDYFSNDQLILIEELGVIFGSFSFILLLFLFNQSYLDSLQKFLTKLGIIMFGFIGGTKIALVLKNDTTNSIYGLYISNGGLKRFTDPFITILVFFAFTSLVIVFWKFSIWQNNFPEYLTSKKLKNNSRYSFYLIFCGVILNYLGLFLPINLFGVSNVLFLISRFFITFAYIFITLIIAQNPIISLNEKGDTRYLVDKGIIGWILVANTDHGPETKSISKASKVIYDIKEKESMLFAVGSITIIGIGQNFIDNQFIIPFPMKEEKISVICYSFNINDPTLTDPRKKNIADIVFGIIIPNNLLNYLGSFVKDSFSIKKNIQSYDSLQSFIDNTNFPSETNNTLRNFLVYKMV